MNNIFLILLQFEVKIWIRRNIISGSILYYVLLSLIFIISTDLNTYNYNNFIGFLTFVILQKNSYQLFERDFKSGILEQLIMQGRYAEIVALIRIIVYWILNIILTIPALLLCCIINNNINSYFSLLCNICLYSFVLNIFIGISSGMSLGVRQNSFIAQIIIIPLILPIFMIISQSIHDDRILNINNAVLMLFAILMLPLAVLISSASIRVFLR